MVYLKRLSVAAAAFIFPVVLYAVSVVIWARYYVPTLLPPAPPLPFPSPPEVGFTTSTDWVEVRFPVPEWVPLIIGLLAFGIAYCWIRRRTSIP
jgi:hypothetical protein